MYVSNVWEFTMKNISTKEKVMRILSSNQNILLTSRNIQHLIRSKWDVKMPPDGTVSSILYKLTQQGITERQEDVGRLKGYGYKLTKSINIPKEEKSSNIKTPAVQNPLFRMEL